MKYHDDLEKQLAAAQEDANIWARRYKAAVDQLGRTTEAQMRALQQISDMGPMSVDDQRWRIAREAITSAAPASQLPVGS